MTFSFTHFASSFTYYDIVDQVVCLLVDHVQFSFVVFCSKKLFIIDCSTALKECLLTVIHVSPSVFFSDISPGITVSADLGVEISTMMWWCCVYSLMFCVFSAEVVKKCINFFICSCWHQSTGLLQTWCETWHTWTDPISNCIMYHYTTSYCIAFIDMSCMLNCWEPWHDWILSRSMRKWVAHKWDCTLFSINWLTIQWWSWKKWLIEN